MTLVVASRKCKALTKTGAPCGRFASVGSDTCSGHSKVTVAVAPTGNGRVNQAKRASADRAAAEMAERFGGDPTEILRTAVERTDHMCRRIEEMLERAEVEDKEVWPALRMYREFMMTLAEVAKKDLDAGVQRRRLQLDEARARIVVAALDRALEVAVPSDAMRHQIRTEVGRQLQISHDG